MNKYEVRFTARAFFDVKEIVSFVKNVSIEAANNLYEEIISAAKELSDFPNSYPEIEAISILGQKARRMVFHDGRYFFIYVVKENLVTIYDIFDSRKDNNQFLL